MTKIDWDALTLDELTKIQRDVTKAIGAYKARKMKDALAAAQAAAAEHGFTLAELDVPAKAKRAKTKSEPKYAHPENPSKTWTGRGRQPDWIKAHINAGKSVDDFLIAG